MIEFQFFEGCPNSKRSLENLKELISERVIPAEEIRITEIMSPEDAEKFNFQGSPTILINGIDIYNGEVPVSSSFACRSYVFDGKRTGILSKEFIKSKIMEFLKIDRKEAENSKKQKVSIERPSKRKSE